jgi:hypothetical protein
VAARDRLRRLARTWPGPGAEAALRSLIAGETASDADSESEFSNANKYFADRRVPADPPLARARRAHWQAARPVIIIRCSSPRRTEEPLQLKHPSLANPFRKSDENCVQVPYYNDTMLYMER